MKLLIDNQLPLQLAIHLRNRGHDCMHVLDANLAREQDANLWDFAKTQNRTIVSKDEDFVFLASRPRETGSLIWVRLGNCRNSVLTAAFDRIHDDLVRAIESGQRIVEIR